MKVVVFLKRGASLAYEDARVTPASTATPYYVVVLKEGLVYFDKDSVERIMELKEEA
jgi:hypothetical protein